MSIKLSVYVGPYLECQDCDVDIEAVEHLLCDGRREAAEKDENLILISNGSVPGITRRLHTDEYGETRYQQITEEQVAAEKMAFRHYAISVITDLSDANAFCYVGWGVIPCWS